MVTSPYRTVTSKFLTALMIAGSLCGCSTLAASEQSSEPVAIPSPGPALWTLADENTKVHLFGFAPVLKTGSEWQNELISRSLAEANLFVIEVDNSSPEAQAAVQALIPQIGLNTDGSTLSSRLKEGERREIDQVSSRLGAPLAALDQLKPWLASVQLGVLAISRGGYDLANTPSNQLLSQARSSNIMIESFEGPTDLMRIMASLSEEEQVGMLLHGARSLRDRPDQQAAIADAWLSGDVERVGELLHGEEGAWSSDTIYNTVLVARNQAWHKEIKDLLATHEGTVFVTVGLGHFAGEDSLINMLESDGLDVKRR